MTEHDIRGNGLALLHMLGRHIVEDCKPGQKADAEAAVEATGQIIIQAFVDLNRIADALEYIALNTRPTPQV